MSETPETATALIIGAGPAGLAAAACLQREGISAIVLERDERIAPAWHRHYDRLHLHTVKQHSALPFRPFAKDFPKYPSRLQVVDYLEDYARAFGIAPRFGIEVRRAERRNDVWRVITDNGVFEAPSLVVATGFNRMPYRPAFEGLDGFEGPVVHSGAYKSGAAHKGQRVLVVGCGNSGAEIAIDLQEQGAHASLVVRGPVHVVPRDLWGRPSQVSAIMMSRLPTAVADAITRVLLRLNLGDLSAYGFVRPAQGPRAMVEATGRSPILDIGLVPLVKAGLVQVVPGVQRIEPKAVTFADGRTLPFDAIVLATGYRPDLAQFLEGADEMTDDSGCPTTHGGEAARPGLYFVGLCHPVTGILREISIEAPAAAKAIAADARANRTSRPAAA